MKQSDSNLNYSLERLSNNVSAFKGLMLNVSDEQARWKPSPEKWSILEVVNHLYDEERDDFRTRLDLLLHHRERRWPPINPPLWAIERKYNERQLGESVERFLREREESIEWLKGLNEPDWERQYEHPRGVISAGDLLASWLAHDFLHIRQLTRLHWQYLNHIASPYRTVYAGEW
jgi:hypothetical protein